MDFIPKAIDDYVTAHTQQPGTLLDRIERETWLEVNMPRMLSGHLQGQVLRMFSMMIQPKKILEIGTYTGYATICLAQGLMKGGTITTLDINQELENKVRGYFQEAQKDLIGKIDFRVGDARKIIDELEGPLDLVFIDADKVNYSLYYDKVIDRVTEGGYIIADNVLWSGKVLEIDTDADTHAIQQFNG